MAVEWKDDDKLIDHQIWGYRMFRKPKEATLWCHQTWLQNRGLNGKVIELKMVSMFKQATFDDTVRQ